MTETFVFTFFFLLYSLQTYLFLLGIYPSPSSCLGSYAAYQPCGACSCPEFGNKPKITHHTATLGERLPRNLQP